MATIADLSVQIGADVSQFTRDMRRLERQFSNAGRNMTEATRDVNRQFQNMSRDIAPVRQSLSDFGTNGRNSLEGMRQETARLTGQLEQFRASVQNGGQDTNREFTQAQDDLNGVRQELSTLTTMTRQYGPTLGASLAESMRPMIDLQRRSRDLRREMAEITLDPSRFRGDTDAFLSEIERIGVAQRGINDGMMAANRVGVAALAQQAGSLLAMSTQSGKILSNLTRMGAPLGGLNSALLNVGSGLERMAHRGNAVVMAFRALGPSANLKQLNDYIRMVNAGLMRTTMLALGMGLVFFGVLGGINKLLEANGLTKMSDAAKELGQTLNTSLLPFLKSFDAFMGAVLGGVNAVAQLWAKFSQLNPEISAAIGWFALLFIGLMVLLSPMAVGIGLAGGLTASFSALWVVISPFVIGFLTVAGTALVIAAALVAVGAAVYLLWTRTTWFKDAVMGVWEAIKTGTAAAWNAILAFIQPAIEAIRAFIEDKMTQVRAFWDENGAMIMQAATNVWTFIQNSIGVVIMAIVAIFKWAWPFIQFLIVGTWEAIKNTINGAINIILGVIKFFAALFTGDWGALWESVKQIISGALELIWGWVQLFGAGRLLKFFSGIGSKLLNIITDMWSKIKYEFDFKMLQISDSVSGVFNNIVNFVKGLGTTFFNAGKGLIDQMKAGIEAAASKVLDSVKKIAGQIRDFLPFSPAKVGPLSDLDKLDFGGPIADSITNAIPRISGLMNDMLTMPGITMESAAGGSDSEAVAAGDTYHLNIQLNAKDLTEMTDIYEFFSTLKQVKRARGYA